MIYQIPAGTDFEMRRKIFPALVFPPVLWYAGIRQKTTGVDTMAEQEMLLDTEALTPPRPAFWIIADYVIANSM